MERGAVRVGVIGAGNIGAALVGILSDPSRQHALLDGATAPLELVGVAVRDLTRARPGVDPSLLTDDVASLLAKDLDVLVEVAGGLAPAGEYVRAALERGVSVVTANKALMAERGNALARLAHEHGADLFYEAAVGGAIPILRALRTSLAGERISRVLGIVNGTTNFILTRMTQEGSDYAVALAEAQALGYAEADPRADVEGTDAAAKVAILSALAFGTPLAGEDVAHEGITGVRPVDVEFARHAGYVIKLLAVAERVGESGVSRRVHPTLVPSAHPLAAVSGATNAVFVEGAKAGALMWLGQGAGGEPSATAVLGDVLDAARNKVSGRHDAPFSGDRTLELVEAGDLESAYYLSIDVVDRPGVLAEVAGVFGRHGVSIRSMEQSGLADEARLSLLTHAARDRDVRATVDELAALAAVDAVGACTRVLGGAA